MRINRMAHTLLFLLILFSPLSAQAGDPSKLSLERIFASPEFAVRGYGNTQARWLDDGSAYTVFELSTSLSRAVDIVRHDPATGDGTVIVPAFRLVPAGASRQLDVEDYIWSLDGRQLLVFTNSQRVWRSNTRGDYWVLSLDDWSLRQLAIRVRHPDHHSW